MSVATCKFVNYMPLPAPSLSGRRPTKIARTAEPERGWFAQDSVLRKVSTVLEPLLALAAPPNALALAIAHEASEAAAQDARTEAMHALLRELISYQFLPHDWDGYDGQPASPHATLDALEFLLQLPHALPLPAPMLAGSGAIGLYWDRGDHYASLEFEGDGTYTFLTDDPAGYGGAEGVPAGTVPAALRQYLATLPAAG